MLNNLVCEKLTNHVESLSALPTLSDWSLGRCRLSCSVAPKLRKCGLGLGARAEIRGVTKLVGQRTFLHCVLFDPFWPGGFLLACSPRCLVGVHFGGNVDLGESEVFEDW